MSSNLNTLKIISKKIVLDFSKNNYVTVTAKQNDKNSRYVLIQLTNNGSQIKLSTDLIAQIRMLTPDNRSILEDVTIQEDGSLLVELTEEMLLTPGKAEAEINIYELKENNSSLLSTLNFCVMVHRSPYENSRVIASDEFNALVDLYEKMNTLLVRSESDEVISKTEPSYLVKGDFWLMEY